MTTIDIPDHSVVVAIGGKRDPIAELLDLVDAPSVPWDVNTPKECEDTLHAALSIQPRARVAMKFAHAKALKQVASIAKRHGCGTVVLRLPRSPAIDKYPSRALVREVAVPLDVQFKRTPMGADMRALAGPFDLIGDVHGCLPELRKLLTKLGHMVDGEPVRHVDGRIPVLLGDLTDRGPDSKGVLELAKRMTPIGGLAILGNHCFKLMRWLEGAPVEIKAGIVTTIAELETTDAAWRRDMAEWLGTLPYHIILDEGRLIVAHAGLEERLHGRSSPGAQAFALYGKLKGDGSLDSEGFPDAVDWALEYEGKAIIVQGHVARPEGRIVFNKAGGSVWAIDTGCVFGGSLTAMRYPERELVSVPAMRAYADPKKRMREAQL